MGQIIENSIRVYFNTAKKLDFIFKQAYNKGLDIKCVGSGIGDRGGTYLLFIHSESLMDVLNDWENRTMNL